MTLGAGNRSEDLGTSELFCILRKQYNKCLFLACGQRCTVTEKRFGPTSYSAAHVHKYACAVYCTQNTEVHPEVKYYTVSAGVGTSFMSTAVLLWGKETCQGWWRWPGEKHRVKHDFMCGCYRADLTFSHFNLDPFQLVDKNCRVLGVNVFVGQKSLSYTSSVINWGLLKFNGCIQLPSQEGFSHCSTRAAENTLTASSAKERVHTDTYQSGLTWTSARGFLVLLCSSISRKLTKHGACRVVTLETSCSRMRKRSHNTVWG